MKKSAKRRKTLSERNTVSANARRGEWSPKGIADLISKLKSLVRDFEDAKDTCESLRFEPDETFMMDGATKAERGLELLTASHDKTIRAIIKHATDKMRKKS